jgi:hypothetical protein
LGCALYIRCALSVEKYGNVRELVIGAVIDVFEERNGTTGDMKRGNISEAVMSDWLNRVACGLFKFFWRAAKFF